MTVKQIKQILTNDFDDDTQFHDQNEFIDDLKSKVNLDWNIHKEISIFEIAFIEYFQLIPYSDLLLKQKIDLTYCKKLQTITNKNRLKGIKKAKNKIESIYFAKEDIYIKEPKNSINYKENLESGLSGILKLNDMLVDTCKEILNDTGDDLKNKLLRKSAITHILEINDVIHYLDFNFWIPYLKSKYKNIKFIDHKHNARDIKAGKFNDLNQVIIESTSDSPNYVTLNIPPSTEEVIYKPLREEIRSLLTNNGTKEKNAKEIAGIIVNTYKKLLNF